LDSRAMDKNTKLSDVYNATPQACNSNEDIGNLNGAIN
jgi:hypothetical protein